MINVREYIESGIIEDYVLGSLAAPERSEVERYLVHHNDIATELDSLTTSLSIFAVLGAVEPQPYMQQRIWDAIGSPITAIDSNSDIDIPKRTNLNSGNKVITWVAYSTVAVMAILSLVAIFWANSANNQMEVIREQIETLHTVNHKLNDKVIALNEEIETNNTVYDLPNKQIVELIGKSKKAKNSLAIAIWDKEKGDVYLDIKNIPANPEGTNYQLYAMTQIGQEIKLGLIDLKKKKQIQAVGNIKDAILFKIILEDENLSKNIRTNELFLHGKVHS